MSLGVQMDIKRPLRSKYLATWFSDYFNQFLHLLKCFGLFENSGLGKIRILNVILSEKQCLQICTSRQISILTVHRNIDNTL